MIRARFLLCMSVLSATVLCVPQASAQSRSGFIYNGFDHVSWWFNEYSNFDQPTGPATDSRNALAATGASWTSVLVTQYMTTSTSTTIAPEPSGQKTPTDAAVVFAIQDLHSKGIKVMLKPHVDVLDGTWRGQIHPTDTNAWFQSYTTFITHYAQLAQQNNVEGIIMGTEFVTMSGSANRAQWVSVIAAIRAVYTGILTYAANATFSGDEFTSVSFWDQLDLIGLDAYFPLTNHNDPTVAELVSSWTANANGDHIIAALQNLSSANQKPLIFTELGYKSVPGANTRPYDFSFGAGGPQDQTEQSNCYEAMFEVWSQQTSFMKGVFWWDWPVPAPAAGDLDYNPRGKMAETVLRSWQGPANGSDFSISANPTTLALPQNTSGTSTITITPTTGFTSSVALSVGSLPPGVTASLNPTSTASTSTLTINVSLSAPNGTFPIGITGIGGGRGHSTSVSITITSGQGASFSLSSSPSSVALNQGATATSLITITPSGGFASGVALSATGLPSGVTATFNPGTATTTGTLTLAASSTATLGTTNVTITGTGGGITRTTTVACTVQGVAAPDFSLAATPAGLTVNQGSSGTSTIAITRTNSFAGVISFAASGLPSGVTASFNPVTTTTTGNSSVLTVTASSTATLGAVTMTITGTGGGLTHTSAVTLTIGNGGGGTGGVTVTPVVTSTSPWFNEEQVRIANAGALTALSLTVVVQRTTGISFSGQYNTVGGQITQSNTSTASTVTYQFTLGAGQALGVGTNWTFAEQTSGSGTVHPTSGDTYTVTYTTGGNMFSQTGHF